MYPQFLLINSLVYRNKTSVDICVLPRMWQYDEKRKHEIVEMKSVGISCPLFMDIKLNKGEDKVSKKIILHIAEAPGGVERYLVSFFTKLKNCDEFEHVLICSDLYDIEKFDGLVRTVEVVDSMHNVINVKNDLASVNRVRKLIKKYNPDVVYCHSSKAGAIGRMANVGIKNKLIYNAHGWSFNMREVSSMKIKLYEVTEKILATMTDKIVCISEYEKKSAIEHRICKEDKLQVIYNGIDFDEYGRGRVIRRERLGISADAFVVGMVGRITKQKSPDAFVKMALEVKQKISDAFFLIVGDGDDRENIEQMIGESGLQNSFLITGWVDDPLNYVEIFDVAMLLSRWEGFGLVLPEYMLMKKPIVATRVDAIPEVIGDAGVLVDSKDYQSMAKSAISFYEDEELRKRVVEAGKRQVEKFNVQKNADEHVELFCSNKIDKHIRTSCSSHGLF